MNTAFLIFRANTAGSSRVFYPQRFRLSLVVQLSFIT